MSKNLNLRISLIITILMFISGATVYFVKNKQYSKDVFLYKANNYFSNEQFLNASRYYRKLISMGIEDDEIYKNNAVALIKLGAYENALKYLTNLLDEKPSSELYYLLGYTYYSRGQLYLSETDMHESVKYLKKSVESDNENTNAYFLLGQIYENLKQFEQARSSYRKALYKNNSNPSEVYRFIGYTYFKQAMYEEAVKSYDKAGEVYKFMNNFDKAKQYYNKAIKINPDYILPYYKTGNMYDKVNNYKKAVEWYKKALEIENNNSVVNYCIGMSYKKMNMLEEAVNHLKISAYCGNDDAVNELRKIVSVF